MKAGTHRHMKFRSLQRLLGNAPLYRVVGLLETLWLICIDSCDEGNIGKFSDKAIAEYIEWEGDPSELVRALSDSGWADLDDNGRPVIHDWLDHCPEYIRDRVRKRRARAIKAGGPSEDRQETSTSDRGASDFVRPCPNLSVYTNPNPTQPNQSLLASDDAVRVADGEKPKKGKAYPPEFEVFWTAYPKRDGRKNGKEPAFTLWRKISAEEREPLLQATRRYAQSKIVRIDDKARDAEGFLRKNWWRDWLEPEQPIASDAPKTPAVPREIKKANW